jgi:hypothetical protein
VIYEVVDAQAGRAGVEALAILWGSGFFLLFVLAFCGLCGLPFFRLKEKILTENQVE